MEKEETEQKRMNLRVALVQMTVGRDKSENLERAESLLRQAAGAANRPEMLVLPEIWNSPYDVGCFAEHAEAVPGGPSGNLLSQLARELGVWIVGGSVPERASDGRIYNTCMVFDRAGALRATHRKAHLFDISIPGKISFRESAVLSPGDALTVVATEWGNLGIGICYDMRFPEVAMVAARRDSCFAMVYPGAFNMTTGPLHWELLLRARAVDNQMFVMGCSPARDMAASYVAWGHSTIVDPWGRVLAAAEADEQVIEAQLDLSEQTRMQQQIPVRQQRRFDLYRDCVAPAGP